MQVANSFFLIDQPSQPPIKANATERAIEVKVDVLSLVTSSVPEGTKVLS